MIELSSNQREYDKICREIRGRIIDLSFRAKTPHLASALSSVELVSVLFGDVLKIDSRKPIKDEERDRFILSKGHAASVLYVVLAFFGFIPESLLDSFNQPGSKLAEQPIPGSLPGLEVATGSLGHGLSIGLGMALASKIKHLTYRVFVLMSDGECNEGSVWEAAMMAPVHRLDNLFVIIDYNKWQATGRSNDIMKLSPLKAKWDAFGWKTIEIDGHDTKAILNALQDQSVESDRPTAVIANTVKGKGISFMEDNNDWHYRIPSDTEVLSARKELNLL